MQISDKGTLICALIHPLVRLKRASAALARLTSMPHIEGQFRDPASQSPEAR